MTTPQLMLFAIFGAVMALLVWGRYRYDLVAFAGLIAAVLTGLVPADQAFVGFSHPAVVTVALILIVTAGLMRSGAVGLLAKHLGNPDRPVTAHVGLFSAVGAIMSGFMNNVAALAILMPIDMKVAAKAGRAAGLTLMALAFATILGGMATLIGTPPNLIVSAFRAETLGAPYRMFDFLPVGGVVALAGLVFLALVGWRLMPRGASEAPVAEAERKLRDYVSELKVPEGSPLIGQTLHGFARAAHAADVALLSIRRKGETLRGYLRGAEVRAGDTLVIEASPAALEEFRVAMKLAYPGGKTREASRRAPEGDGQVLVEVLVQTGARIVGQSALSLGLAWRQSAVLMGILRGGETLRDDVRRIRIAPGDILLILAPEETRDEVVDWLGALPLDGGGVEVTKESRIWVALGLFVAAIAAASLGWVSMPVALGVVAIGYVLTGVLTVQEIYDHVDWPVIVLLGAMIPLGLALDSTGASSLIAAGLAALTAGLPGWVALAALMVAVMGLSDVLNNNATTVMAAPVAIRLAEQLGANPDAFLIGVALAASCAFLTPIGHQNNTLVMGPGGYRFGDYWRMGLGLEVIVLAVGIPLILMVWGL